MQNVPIDAQVICTDGQAGTTTAVIFNPVTNELTHFVVRDSSEPTVIERLVPLEVITSTTADSIHLSCTTAELQELELFSETYYFPNDISAVEFYEPYVSPVDIQPATLEAEQIPPGELAIRRGANVEATDGFVGTVEEFLVNPQNSHITHLVLQKGHLWGRKELTLPIGTIDHIAENSVFLKFTKDELAQLPSIPVKRDWEQAGDVELIIWLFDETDSATEALANIKQNPAVEDQNILNTAVLTKDEKGKTSIKEAEDMDAGHGALYGAITGGIIGLLGGPVGVVIGAAAGAATGGAAAHWIDVGFDDTNLRAIRDNLQPGSSALILLVHSEQAQEVLENLEHLGGQRVQQTLSQEILDKLSRPPSGAAEVEQST